MAPDSFREPVSTYGQAKAWLFQHSDFENWLFEPEGDLPPEARLVCDMFWVKAADLVRDMRKIWNDTLMPPPRAFARSDLRRRYHRGR